METSDASAVLLLDLPQGALAGINLLSFTTTPRFRGIKNLPPGLHFVFAGSSTAFSERHGLWVSIDAKNSSGKGNDLVVAKWDAATETMTIVSDETEMLRHRANLGSMWDGLMPYRQVVPKTADDEDVNEESTDWPTLTSSITPSLLSRILGNDTEWKLSSASSSKRDLEDIPGLSATDLKLDSEQELHFLPVDLKQTWRSGATGRERTNAAQDRSWALEHLINTPDHHNEASQIIGELQFCFLMILTINNFSCLEQWKRLLSLLFTCKSAVATKPDLFVSAIAALRLQIQHCKDAEGGLIDLGDEGGSLLKQLLVRFRKGLDEKMQGLVEVQDVVDELDDLEAYLAQEHGWQLGGTFARSGVLELEDGEQLRVDTTAFDEDDETGEFAPQVVDLTPEQARMLGVQDEFDLPNGFSRASLKGSSIEGEASSDNGDHHNGNQNDESEESEEDQDLDDMDARF